MKSGKMFGIVLCLEKNEKKVSQRCKQAFKDVGAK